MNEMIRAIRLCSTVSLLTDYLYFTNGLNVLERLKCCVLLPVVAALLTSSQVLQGFNSSFHYVIMVYFLLDLIVIKIRQWFNS